MTVKHVSCLCRVLFLRAHRRLAGRIVPGCITCGRRDVFTDEVDYLALTSSFRRGMLTPQDGGPPWSFVEAIVGQRPRSPLSSRSAWHRQPSRRLAAGGAQAPAGAQAGGQAPAGGAQGRGGGGGRGGGAPYTPAAGAKDLRAALFNWMWHQGMLKGADERDMVATLEYQAKGGTIQVDGQPCTLSKLRASTNYQTFSQRIQLHLHAPEQADGLEHRGGQLAVRVERGHAWRGDRRHERQGRGDAGRRAGAAHSHLGQSAGRGRSPRWRGPWTRGRLGANPSTVHRRRRDEGRQHDRCRGTPRARRSSPSRFPALQGATGTATLDAKYMTEKVVVTQGADTTEFTYSNYQDWNNPLHKIEVFYAGRLIERKNGAVVRDLTTRETETGNVYVVAPVPPSVQKAMNVTTKAADASCGRRTSPPRTGRRRRRGSARFPT